MSAIINNVLTYEMCKGVRPAIRNCRLSVSKGSIVFDLKSVNRCCDDFNTWVLGSTLFTPVIHYILP